jgi:phosphate transport system protein
MAHRTRWTEANTLAPPQPRLDVDDLDRRVVQLFAMVEEGVVAATAAFLDADRDVAHALVLADETIDGMEASIDGIVQRELVHPGGLCEADLRFLLVLLRVVPELERSGDLVEHIALRATPDVVGVLTPRARGLVQRMGTVAATMWRAAATAFAERNPRIAELLREIDDELDDLHVSFTAELAAATLSTAIAIELGLVARFYERLGDHAVNVVRRLRHLAPGPAGMP